MHRDYCKPNPIQQWLSKPRNVVAVLLSLVVVYAAGMAMYASVQGGPF